jgi:hypothetical protein
MMISEPTLRLGSGNARDEGARMTKAPLDRPVQKESVLAKSFGL